MIIEAMGAPVYLNAAGVRDITIPSGRVTDDVVMLIIAAFDSGNAALLNAPAGWTVLKKDLVVSNIRVSILTAPVGTTFDKSFTFNVANAVESNHVTMLIRGTDAAYTPIIGATGTRAASGGTNLITLPAITLVRPSSRVYALSFERTNAAETATPAVTGGMVTKGFYWSGTQAQSIFVAGKDYAAGDSGAITVGPYSNNHATNGLGLLIGFADKGLPVSDFSQSDIYLVDGFNRTVPNGWGNPDVGPAYVVSESSQDGMSVLSGVGLITKSATNQAIRISTPIAATDNLSSSITTSHDKIPDNGSVSTRVIVREVGTSDYHLRMWLRPSGHLEAQFGIGDASLLGTLFDFGVYTPNREYNVRVEAVGVNPTTLRAKIWWASDAEPTAWTITVSDSTPAMQFPGTPSYRWVIGSAPGAPTNGPFTSRHKNYTIRKATTADSTVRTGQLSSAISVNPTSNTLTVGVDKIAGSVVQVVLRNSAGLELSRQTVTFDSYGWGNVTFTTVSPDQPYKVTFDVDFVQQTDTELNVRTLPTGNASFKAVAGSCQFTASNHPVFNKMANVGAAFIAHMGDMHYLDTTDKAIWRGGIRSSMAASLFRDLLSTTPLVWTPDNHDRVITNPTGAGTGLNLGETDPYTQQSWKAIAGAAGWASPDGLGRTWVAGRVRFIQTDGWSERDDGDGDPEPRTFLGATQKAWFKNVLSNASEQIIVWFCSWTAKNNANGRWNSFPTETTELEQFIDARPDVKARMIMIGGDSHSLQADNGSRPGNANGYRFPGIPSLNISGFNRSSDAGDGSANWSIANAALRTSAQLEADWGGYSRMTFTDNGANIDFFWEGVRVDKNGVEDVMATYTKRFVPPEPETPEGYYVLQLFEWDGVSEIPLNLIGP